MKNKRVVHKFEMDMFGCISAMCGFLLIEKDTKRIKHNWHKVTCLNCLKRKPK